VFLLSIPEMLFVVISCSDNMSWLITTRAFHGASEIVAPIRYDLDASDANIISGGRRASFSLDFALRLYFVGGRQ
jgi:hypothetical protein